MTLPGKGNRTIVVDGRTFRWRIRQKPTYGQAIAEQGLSVAIEAETGGATLVVTLPGQRPDAWVASEPATVKPGDVERFIRGGVARGWEPGVDGATFELRSDEIA